MVLETVTILGSLAELVEKIMARYKKTHQGQTGLMRAVLSETRLNLERTDDYFEHHNAIEKVIASLKIEALHKALFESDLNLNKLQPKAVAVRKLFAEPSAFLRQYDGWSTERLFVNIYEKIKRVQEINAEYGDTPAYRLALRLRNIRHLIILLLKHLA